MLESAESQCLLAVSDKIKQMDLQLTTVADSVRAHQQVPAERLDSLGRVEDNWEWMKGNRLEKPMQSLQACVRLRKELEQFKGKVDEAVREWEKHLRELNKEASVSDGNCEMVFFYCISKVTIS